MDLYRFLESKKVRATAVLSAAVFFIAALYFWDPTGYQYYPPCWFHELTGLYCPGCGGLRGTHFLLHFDFDRAFHFNPSVFISTPLIIYSIVYYSAFLFLKKDLIGIPVNKYTINVSAILIALFWIARNIFAFFKI
ncbi:MAG: DUF2752 domain-containing protein [Ignavibacteria bacterium]|nr:DUF2752 domain-containing protein [Ignavibacteria bacterium]